jgi:hypothetical protein
MHQVLVRVIPVSALVAIIVAFTVAADGAEYNFYEQADRQGCASIITERGQDECSRVQTAKNQACSLPVECNFDSFERDVSAYNRRRSG